MPNIFFIKKNTEFLLNKIQKAWIASQLKARKIKQTHQVQIPTETSLMPLGKAWNHLFYLKLKDKIEIQIGLSSLGWQQV